MSNYVKRVWIEEASVPAGSEQTLCAFCSRLRGDLSRSHHSLTADRSFWCLSGRKEVNGCPVTPTLLEPPGRSGDAGAGRWFCFVVNNNSLQRGHENCVCACVCLSRGIRHCPFKLHLDWWLKLILPSPSELRASELFSLRFLLLFDSEISFVSLFFMESQ